MPLPVELNLKPRAPNSIAWSHDGLIALAGGIEIHILLPRLRASGETYDPDEDEFEHLYFEAASFPGVLWPTEVYSQGSTQEYFLAREQRLSEVVGLGWSPPGLASHDRCALGVLTSNGYLSVVIPGAKERSAGGWARRAVIRGVRMGERERKAAESLKEKKEREKRGYEAGNGITTEPSTTLTELERGTLALSGQIRAWCWAPAAWNQTDTDAQKFWVVVVTDKVVALVSFAWHDDTLATDLDAELEIPKEWQESPGGLLGVAERDQHGVHLSWVPPADVDEHALHKKAHVVVACQGRIRHLFINKADQASGMPKLAWLSNGVEGHGPLAISRERIYYVKEDCIESLSYMPEKFFLPDRAGDHGSSSSLHGWDAPSSMAPFAHGIISTQLLSLASFTNEEKGNLHTRYLTSGSRLHKEIQRAREEYGEDNELGNRTLVRMHGIATYVDTNTKKKWLATVVNLHPSDQIQYKLKTNERSTVLFSHEDLEPAAADTSQEQSPSELPDGSIPANPIFPWCLETAAPDVGHDVVCSQVLHAMPKLGLDPTPETKQIAFLQLLAHVVQQSPVQHVREAMHVLGVFDAGVWERELGARFGSELNGLAAGSGAVSRMLLATKESKRAGDVLEHCLIPDCGTAMLFVDGPGALDEAGCEKGHRYGRCGLTLMTIQRPYISKRCDSCSRTFFDEDKVPKDWHSVKAIVSHFKKCPYCGGKFGS